MTRDEVEAVIADFVRRAKSNEAMHTDWSVMSSQAWYHATDLLREALDKSEPHRGTVGLSWDDSARAVVLNVPLAESKVRR